MDQLDLKSSRMSYIIMAIVLLHIVAGFAWFIWKLEIQGKKKKNDQDVSQKDENEG